MLNNCEETVTLSNNGNDYSNSNTSHEFSNDTLDSKTANLRFFFPNKNHSLSKVTDEDPNVNSTIIESESSQFSNDKKEKLLFNLKQLKVIRGLGKDWGHKGTHPFNKKLINKVLSMITKVRYQPYLFPTFEDSIQIEYELSDEYYLEFEIFLESIRVYCEKPSGDSEYTIPYRRELPVDQINKIVGKFYYEFGN